MTPRHGSIIEPKDRFLTYAVSIDVSHEVLIGGIEAEQRLIAEADARARKAAADIDPDCPIIVTVGATRKLPDPSPFCERWGVHVRVEFQRYVYDDTKRLNQEWERMKHRYT